MGRKQDSGGDAWFSLIVTLFILLAYACVFFNFLGKEIRRKKDKKEIVFKINKHESIKIT